MKALHIIAFLLVAIGGLNWGLVGVGALAGSELNVVHMVVGMWPAVEAIVYVLVGLSTILLLATHKKECRACSGM